MTSMFYICSWVVTLNTKLSSLCMLKVIFFSSDTSSLLTFFHRIVLKTFWDSVCCCLSYSLTWMSSVLTVKLHFSLNMLLIRFTFYLVPNTLKKFICSMLVNNGLSYSMKGLRGFSFKTIDWSNSMESFIETVSFWVM